MKSYEEMAKCVLERRDRQLKIKHKRRMTILKSLTAASSMCLAILLSFGVWKLTETKNEFIDPGIESTAQTKIPDTTEASCNTYVAPHNYNDMNDTASDVSDVTEDNTRFCGPENIPEKINTAVTTHKKNSHGSEHKISSTRVTSVPAARPSVTKPHTTHCNPSVHTTAAVSHISPPLTEMQVTDNIPTVKTTAPVTQKPYPVTTTAEGNMPPYDDSPPPTDSDDEPCDPDIPIIPPPAVTTIPPSISDEPCDTAGPPGHAPSVTTTTTTVTTTTAVAAESEASYPAASGISYNILPDDADAENKFRYYPFYDTDFPFRYRKGN